MTKLTPGQLLALKYRLQGYRVVEIAQMMHSTKDNIHGLLNKAYKKMGLSLHPHDLRFHREVSIKNAFNEYKKEYKLND